MDPTETLLDDHLLEPPALDLDEVASSLVWIESHPVTDVPIDVLVFDNSPRLSGQDEEHVRLLAEAGDNLPPITVHRPTMRVIDGAHRVSAAVLNGRRLIRARLVDCDEGAAFVLGVKANVTHGLPLSRSDRAAAAARIIRTNPEWSDRAVAAAAGLSDKTVSRIRFRSGTETPQTAARLGRDGRLRPLDSGLRRQQAAAVFLDRPDAGLREVARATGLSPATVRDVRDRIDRGEDPVPERYRVAARTADDDPDAPRRGESVQHSWPRYATADRRRLLAKLSEDPSLRLNENGRRAIRWLHRYSLGDDGLEELSRGVPPHWYHEVVELARGCAAAWMTLAEQIQERIA